MKTSRIKMITALAAMLLLLGGCKEAPYTLTDSERDLIVHYSAHVVTKFNTDQDKGLTYVKPDTAEETEVREPETENGPEIPATVPGRTETAADSETSAVSLNDIFGSENLTVSYTGAYLTRHYAENSYYSVDAEAGKIYLELDFEIANSGAADEDIDCLARKPYYQVTLEDGKKINSELTLLMEDFSAYQATIPAGETQHTVLLFQIPDTYTEVPDFTLSISVGEASYQITL